MADAERGEVRSVIAGSSVLLNASASGLGAEVEAIPGQYGAAYWIEEGYDCLLFDIGEKEGEEVRSEKTSRSGNWLELSEISINQSNVSLDLQHLPLQQQRSAVILAFICTIQLLLYILVNSVEPKDRAYCLKIHDCDNVDVNSISQARSILPNLLLHGAAIDVQYATP